MRYSGTDRDDDAAAWFRLGSFPVTTTTLVLLVWVATLLMWTAEPVSKPITEQLVFVTSDVKSGELWRLFTWPWAHAQFSLWDIISAAIVFLFGSELERQVGRNRFAALLGSALVIIPLSAVFFSALLGDETAFADLDLISLTVILLYCAEHPTRPFFFNIPAWVIAAVIVALEVINDLSGRDWVRLLTVLLASGLIALVARKVDLLSNYDRLPDLKLPGGKSRAQRRENKRRAAGARGRGKAAPPKSSAPKRPGSLWGRKQEQEPAEIVQMPTRPRPRPVESAMPDVSADDLALDLLLDKISEGGLESLTDAERASLDELTARRRGKPS